jgi:hypothetical protein
MLHKAPLLETSPDDLSPNKISWSNKSHVQYVIVHYTSTTLVHPYFQNVCVL